MASGESAEGRLKARTASGSIAAFALLSTLAACKLGGSAPIPKVPPPKVEALAAQAQHFERGVREVADGVYLALGFGLANSILLEGDDAAVVVDTMATIEQATAVRAAFREVSDLPIRALVYTHNHADHVFGSPAFVDDPENPPEVWAHATTARAIERIAAVYRPIIGLRSLRMFGSLLSDADRLNDGIGPELGIGPDSHFGLLAPTKTFDEAATLEFPGLRLELVHAPGETDDQIFVWIPDRGVLLPGDNWYRAFPNLYTIRGTPHRSLVSWADSLDAMRALAPKVLVPSHTAPVVGEAEVARALTDYRDAIRFVHDQSVRGINRGLTPDELVQTVRLPPHLAASPYLQEFYGKVEWSVRAVFAGNLGWFDGNPSQLSPLAPQARAKRLAELAGGAPKLREAVRRAAEAEDWQWLLEISDESLRLDPDDDEVLAARIRALEALGHAEGNPNARHYYLTSALELRGELRPDVPLGSKAVLEAIPLQRFFDGLAVRLDAAAALELDQRVGFTFPDTGQTYTMWVRRGVLEVQPRLLDGLDLHVEVPARVWKEMLARHRSAPLTILRDVEYHRGGRVAFATFLALFR